MRANAWHLAWIGMGVTLVGGACPRAADRIELAASGAAGERAPASQPARPWTGTRKGTLEVNGRTRTYQLHVPSAYDGTRPVALVLVFHGGGGSGANTARWTGFDALSERAGFLVAYPDGVNHHWIDGRNARFQNVAGVDDVAFIAALLDALGAEFRIDPRRIYAAGMSNGAMFCHYLALRLSDRIAAIAPVAGGLPEPEAATPLPHGPISVIAFNGTADALVPFEGGAIVRDRGRVLGARATARRWAELNGCAPHPVSQALPDLDPRDGTTVTRETWSGGRAGAEVVLYVIEGGGHTWPGIDKWRYRRTGAAVSHDIDATALIWEFFERHPRPE